MNTIVFKNQGGDNFQKVSMKIGPRTTKIVFFYFLNLHMFLDFMKKTIPLY